MSMRSFNRLEVSFENNEETESIEEGKKRFEDIKQHIEKLRQIIDEQCDAGNYRWMKAVEKCFNGTRKLVNDVEKYRRRNTNPRTWADHNANTLFLE